MSRNDPLGDLFINVRASADAFSADMKKVQASASNTTNAIVAGWGKSGDAATAAVRQMEQRAQNKAILQSFDATTTGITKGWGKAEEAAKTAGSRTGRSFDQAGSALKSIEQMLGVQLPNAAGKFLEKSAAIGPILSGAFSAIAVVGMIQALSQLPALFEKITGAVTGWNEASRKAYAGFIEDNRKAIAAAEQLRLKQIELTSGKVASAAEGVRIETEKNNQLLRERAALLDKVARIERQGIGQRLMFGGQAELAEARKRLAEINAEMEGAGARLRVANAKLTDERIEGNQKTANDLAKRQEKAAEDAQRHNRETAVFWANALQDFRNRAVSGGEEVAAGLRVADSMVKKILDQDRDHLKLLQDAGDELIRQQEYWNKQLDDFRNRVPADVKAGEDAADAAAKRIIDGAKETNKVYADVFRSVKSTASQAFLDIFRDGQMKFKNLAGVITGIFRTLAAELLSTMTAKLITPLVASLSGMLGKIPGMGGIFGTAAAGGGSAAGGAAAGGGGLAGGLSAAKLGAFFTNPFTIAAAAGIIGTTAWLKSQAHHEANTFVKQFQNPFGAELDRIMASSAAATDKLKEVESHWAEFSQAAQQFAAAGSDEALVVGQAMGHLTPLIENLRRDLGSVGETVRTITPAQTGPITQIIQVDGRTLARIVSPHLYALTRNEGWLLQGAR